MKESFKVHNAQEFEITLKSLENSSNPPIIFQMAINRRENAFDRWHDHCLHTIGAFLLTNTKATMAILK